MSKKAPRAALKSHMKKKSDIRIGKNADLMMLRYAIESPVVFIWPKQASVQLNLLLVLHRLAEESRVKAFEEKTATIKAHHVKAVAKSLHILKVLCGLLYLMLIFRSYFTLALDLPNAVAMVMKVFLCPPVIHYHLTQCGFKLYKLIRIV
ncbi:hypothetical protein NFI96_010228 [Prochilodus magdalenae]|nr:hypothetical protein NFI96_010228 [Prochilodus magdalenae]